MRISTVSVLVLVTMLVTAVAGVTSPSATGRDLPDGFVFRMTARDSAVIDSLGSRWQPRDASWPVSRLSSSLVGKEIDGTDDDALYQVAAVSSPGLRIAVPAAGRYQVRLLTAEGWWADPGRRVFVVSAENGAVSRRIDIAGSVGMRRAYDVVFDVPVTDGSLDLAFTQLVEVSIVAGVEVRAVPTVTTPLPTATQNTDPPATTTSPPSPPTSSSSSSEPGPSGSSTGPPGSTTSPPEPTSTSSETPSEPDETFAFRMTAARTTLVDAAGRSWQPLGVNLGGIERSEPFGDRDILGTDDDDLYRTNIWGTRGVVVPVPARGEYRVRLLFSAEPWLQPGQRVFDVVAEGKTLANSLDVAEAAGPQRAYDLVAPVRVDDGALTVRITARAGSPLVAGVEVSSTDPALAGMIDTPARLVDLGATDVYAPVLTSAPVAANSSAIVARIAADVASRYGGIAAVNAFQYNASVYRVEPDQERIDVGFHDCQNRGVVPDGLYDGPAHFTDVPVPAHATAAVGTDGEMTIYDPASDTIWEFWQMRKNTTSGAWEACWGGRIDGLSTSGGVFGAPFGVSASGLVMAGGVISIEEAMRGRIDHAMILGVIDARMAPSWPATRSDGTSTDPDVVSEGQRLRLDPSINVQSLGLTPFGEMVARAAQTHGFIVADRAGAVGIATESGRPVKDRTGTDPWEVLLGTASYAALKGFPWDRLEALPLDHGRPEAG